MAERFRSGLSPQLMRSRGFWRAVSGLTRSPFGRPGSPADAVAMSFAIRNTRDAYLHRGPVVWASLMLPSELLHGCGVIAFYPEVAAAVATSGGLAPRFIDRAAARGFSADLCSFHRLLLGAALEDFLPPPDLMLSTGSLCDSAPLSFACMAEFYGVDHISIDVPMTSPGGEAVEILAEQLESAARRLRLLTGASEAGMLRGLAGAARLSNRARRSMLEIEEMRRQGPPRMSGWDALGHVAAITNLPGHEAGVRMYEEMARHLRDAPVLRGADGHRLLWMHLKPYFQTSLASILEERGAAIVCEEYNRCSWPELDPADVFHSLARKMTSHPSAGTADRRARALSGLALEYGVDGAVHFSHRGCRQSVGCARQVKDELAAVGVRTLVLDGECVDPREHNEGQARTRLEAFLESLGQTGP